MRVTGTRTYYRPSPPKMPPGLIELMEGMTKEVLKNNPTDIYGYCASHFQRLLEIREGSSKSKPLSLEEKIAMAQEKVRQKAEKRRQEYDALLLTKQSKNAGSTEATTSKDTDDTLQPPSQEHTDSIVNIINNQVHRVQSTLADSSEVEIAHETEIPATNEDHNDVKETVEDTCSLKTAKNIQGGQLQTETDNIVKSNAVEVDAQLPQNEKITNSDLIEDQQGALTTENDGESVVELTKQISNSEEKVENPLDVEEHSTHELGSEIHTANKVELTESDNATESPMNDKEHTDENFGSESIKTNDTVQADSVISDPKLLRNESEKPTMVSNSSELSQAEESTTQLSYIKNVDTDPKDHDQDDGKTLDVCINEGPSIELQSSNPDALASQHGTDTDSDVSSLITQSTNQESLQQNPNISGINHDHEENANINNFENEDTESNATVLSVEEQHVNEMDAEITDKNRKLENQTSGNQNTNNMDLETAAVTIQKVFRTFLFKSRGSTFDDTDNGELDDDEKVKEECVFPVEGTINLERRPHGLTRMDTVLQTVNEEKSLSLSTDDSSTLSSAATVIQAHVRGFLVRNKLNSNKTISSNSTLAANSTEPSASMEMDNEQNKNKTILNIHIVPEGGNYLSRDESLITSMDLSLDSSPPSSINLHPLGSGTSERRKQLKREDAVQSISPPSNNSGKLSEDVDSVKELSITDPVSTETQIESCISVKDETQQQEVTGEARIDHDDKADNTNSNEETPNKNDNGNPETNTNKSISSDEMDVVSPYKSKEDIKLVHSGEYHDAVLPTKVSRNDTAVASGE